MSCHKDNECQVWMLCLKTKDNMAHVKVFCNRQMHKQINFNVIAFMKALETKMNNNADL